MGEFWRRAAYLLTKWKRDRELAEEMAFHQEMADRRGAGSKEFGNELRLREEAREAWGCMWLDHLAQDVRFAGRLMRRSPGFTLAALLTLAAGIGVNVAAFGFFNLAILKPLPVKDPESLVRFHRLAPRNYASDLPYPAFDFYRTRTQTLSAMLALDFARLRLQGVATPLRAHFVSANFFLELGAPAHLGRLLDPSRDEDPAEAAVAVLGYDLWQRQFGADPSVVGRAIQLNGRQAMVVGVLSETFSGLTFNGADVWLPLRKQPEFVTGSPLLTNWSADEDGVDVWGRRKPGVKSAAVEAEMKMLTAELRKLHPEEGWQGERLMVAPGGYAQSAGGRNRSTGPQPGLRQQLAPIFAMVSAMGLLILAVACGNLGSLMLARGVAREREIQIRSSVGAGSLRLVRQLLTESVVLALAASGLGLWAGIQLLNVLMRWTQGPKWLVVQPDWRVIGFTLGVGLLAALLFGLAPALQAGRGLVGQRRSNLWMRKALIGVQVAASCVLLILAGLLARGTREAVTRDPGFAYEQSITVDPGLGGHGIKGAEARRYLEAAKERLLGLPGVEAITMTSTPPLGNRSSTVGGEKDGKQFPIFLHRVDAAYFQMMGIPVLRGRVFREGEKGVALVSESMARRLWPGQDPLAQWLGEGDNRLAVIGVTGNARSLALSDPDAVEQYEPWTEEDLGSMALVVRMAGSVEGRAGDVARAVREVDSVVTPSVQTMREAFARQVESSGKVALAASGLGFVALALAGFGIAGVVSFEASRRMKEIGIRMALGAKPLDVMRAVGQRFVLPVGVGLVLGAAGAAGLSQLLRKELYGVSPLDPLAYAAALALFATMAAAAVVGPARKALSADPVRSLRQD